MRMQGNWKNFPTVETSMAASKGKIQILKRANFYSRISQGLLSFNTHVGTLLRDYIYIFNMNIIYYYMYGFGGVMHRA